jgi:hypothetical protein
MTLPGRTVTLGLQFMGVNPGWEASNIVIYVSAAFWLGMGYWLWKSKGGK